MKKSTFFTLSTKEKIFWIAIGPVAVVIVEYAIYIAAHASRVSL